MCSHQGDLDCWLFTEGSQSGRDTLNLFDDVFVDVSCRPGHVERSEETVPDDGDEFRLGNVSSLVFLLEEGQDLVGGFSLEGK